MAPPKASARKKQRPARRAKFRRAAATARVAAAHGLATTSLAVRLIGPSGGIAVDRVADTFGMSKGQLAETVGLRREALYKVSRSRAPKTQARVKEMLEIVSLVSDWAGGQERAMAWYRSQPIPAFGGRTAEALVKTGNATALRDYLDHIAMGGFA